MTSNLFKVKVAINGRNRKDMILVATRPYGIVVYEDEAKKIIPWHQIYEVEYL
ncbi:MAG: hypothetical protein GQ570_08400 [Helicobacteraceae bacterium]|nr:hypothetical protein [Helicobacteraceae bacterium]